MSFFSDVFGSYQSNPQQEQQLKGNRGESRSRFAQIMENIIGRGQNLADEPTLTAQDLFSEEIRNLTDNARANANATKSALSRGMISRGGDTSGVGALNLLRTDQGANQQIGQITDRFNTLATKIGQARQSRGDSLLSQGLSGAQSLFGADTNILSDFLTREAQKEAANRQSSSGLLGGLLQTAGTLGSAAITACWVAEEVYDDPQKVQQIREYLAGKAGEDTEIGRFVDKYQLHGDRWAEKVRNNTELKKACKRLFDEFYELSKAA